jgi:sugar O-acyltransferase (sialic acid O-acetyltransferase NeuD family)
MAEKNKKQKLVILGAGLFAQEVADYVSKIEEYELIGFVEGIHREKCHETLLDLPVIWIDDVSQLKDHCKGVCAVGTPKRKGFIQQALSLGLTFVTIIYPGAQVSSTAMLGQGTIMSPGAVVAAATRIGSHVILNRGSLIGHHVEIGDYVTISPGANIAGRSKIGDSSYIGIGAVIIDGISVGSNSIVGAGAVVTKDIPNFVQVFGVPARVVKEMK